MFYNPWNVLGVDKYKWADFKIGTLDVVIFRSVVFYNL